jgi:hypothetical protein
MAEERGVLGPCHLVLHGGQDTSRVHDLVELVDGPGRWDAAAQFEGLDAGHRVPHLPAQLAAREARPHPQQLQLAAEGAHHALPGVLSRSFAVFAAHHRRRRDAVVLVIRATFGHLRLP